MNVDSYASAYNLDRMIPKAQQVVIDNFNDAEGIVAVLVDKRFFKIREQYRMMVQDNVNRGLRWNNTYTVKEMFSYSLFYPIIVFTTETVHISSITAHDVGLVTVGTDVDFGGSFSFTSTGVADKAINVKVEGNSSSDTFVIPGTTILRIAKDEKNLKPKANKTASVRVVITSRFDSSIMATIYFTTD